MSACGRRAGPCGDLPLPVFVWPLCRLEITVRQEQLDEDKSKVAMQSHCLRAGIVVNQREMRGRNVEIILIGGDHRLMSGIRHHATRRLYAEFGGLSFHTEFV